MIFTQGHEKIYSSHFVYEHHMYRSVTIWCLLWNFTLFPAFARRHKHCAPECSFMQTRVDYFLPRKYDVISQLHRSYTKDPLCVTQLITCFYLHLLLYQRGHPYPGCKKRVTFKKCTLLLFPGNFYWMEMTKKTSDYDPYKLGKK